MQVHMQWQSQTHEMPVREDINGRALESCRNGDVACDRNSSFANNKGKSANRDHKEKVLTRLK